MMKERGILTFAGFMVALDEDTPEYYREAPAKLEAVDPSAILTSIAIPIPGTPLHTRGGRGGADRRRRICGTTRGTTWSSGRAVVSATDVFDAYQAIPAAFYAWPAVIRRWWRLMKAYWTSPHGRHRLLRTPLLTAILWQLSRFQRVHAQRKVAPVLAEERAKWRRLEASARPVDTLAGAV